MIIYTKICKKYEHLGLYNVILSKLMLIVLTIFFVVERLDLRKNG